MQMLVEEATYKQIAEQVGVTPATVSRWAKSTRVQKELYQARKVREEAMRGVTEVKAAVAADQRGTIRAMLWENVQLARAAGRIDASNRALELLGRDLGMFAERILHGELERELESMDVDQIMLRLKQAILAVGIPVVRQLLDEMGADEAVDVTPEPPEPETTH